MCSCMHACMKTKKWEQMYEHIVYSCLSCIHAYMYENKEMRTNVWAHRVFMLVMYSCVRVWKPRVCVSCVHACMYDNQGCVRRVLMCPCIQSWLCSLYSCEQRLAVPSVCSCMHVWNQEIKTNLCARMQIQGMGTKACLRRASCVHACKSHTKHARVKHSCKCCSLPCGD
jgi:hypothetical protein